MSSERTIQEHKQAFLRSQIRLLSAPLHLTSKDASQDNLPTNVTEEVLAKVNKRIATHARTTFPPNTQRHVAEQINTLYWREVLALPGVGPGKPDPQLTVLGRELDLTAGDVVQRLPETLDDTRLAPAGQGLDAGDEQRYADFRARLVEQTRRREELLKKLAGYRNLQGLLEPYEDATRNVQPNLVTRDGELSRELDRMKMLLARVGAKVAEVDDQGDVQPPVKVETEEEKLAYVLGLG